MNLLEGVGLVPVGGFFSPWGEKKQKVELPLWGLSCYLTRTQGGLALPMEDKGIPVVVGGSSSPLRARIATGVPGDIWHWALLCVGV